MSERLRRWQRLVAGLLQKPSLEGRSRLSSSFAYFIRFEGPLDNVGYEAGFMAGKPMSKITRFCAPNGKLRFGHADFLCGDITPPQAIKWQMMAWCHGFANHQPNNGRLPWTCKSLLSSNVRIINHISVFFRNNAIRRSGLSK